MPKLVEVDKLLTKHVLFMPGGHRKGMKFKGGITIVLSPGGEKIVVYEAVNDGDIGLLLYLLPGSLQASEATKIFVTSAAKS